MLEDAVLSHLASGLRDAFEGSSQDVQIYVGEPAAPLTAADTNVLRIILEDAGSAPSAGVDGGWSYEGRASVVAETYGDSQAARAARQTVNGYFLGLFIREQGLSSARWNPEGWSVRDEGRRRFALGVFNARIYSTERLHQRIGLRTGDGQPLELDLELAQGEGSSA